MPVISAVLKLWGKTKDRNPSATEFHPLLFHLLDVGNSAWLLWQILPVKFQSRIANALGLSLDSAQQVLALLAGIHDLGKASAFQSKAPVLWTDIQALGLEISNPKEHPHAFVTANTKLLPYLLTKTNHCGWTASLPMANALAAITGAHHGRFPMGAVMGKETLGGEDWTRARELLASMLYKHMNLGCNAVIDLGVDELSDVGVGAFLTGFIAVADWIGSSQKHFPVASLASPDDYAIQSRKGAEQALSDFGWAPQPIFAEPSPFGKIIWGRDRMGEAICFEPRRMQEVVASFADSSEAPYLLIAEAAMGDGKTEAALYSVDRATTNGQAQGFYMALPTQATGNAMLGRVKAYLENRGHGAGLNLQLVHGGAEFNDVFAELKLAANAGAQGDEAPVVAESWFNSKKQALLAPFGVGTIDQALMGVLQTKHWFVRLFGLAGKVVVFDEVHAYDVYMGELLESLIRWLSELDCTVILLSATLPTSRRERLIRAYRRDAQVEVEAYPRVTYIPQSGAVACRNVADPEAKTRSVRLVVALPDYAALARTIATDLSEGGCAAVICNTVRQAQAAYSAIQEQLAPEGWEVSLFHARTTLAWRKEREEETLLAFGKPGTEVKPGHWVKRPERAVLIATQVVEQSLDLDFDWMASEMAPVDLLLQRIGRLWRHKRPERKAAEPRFTVLASVEGEGIPQFPSGSNLVYEPYVLLRSWLALRGKTEIILPTEIEPLVSAVYDVSTSAPDASWEEALKKAEQDMEQRRRDDASKARENLIPDPPVNGEFRDVIPHQDHDLLDDDNPAVHESIRATTRLGDPSITLVCLRREANGKLAPLCGGNAIDLVKAPTYWQTKALLQSSVSVARPKGLYWELVRALPPESWKEEAHLRYARCAIFEEGTWTFGSYTATLEKATGLSVMSVMKEEPD
jgi:CRISPR-associated endonuclease/helicase Cas3